MSFLFLQKKRNSERDIWRSSWGSGHSHSSCSIHSNATNGFANGKDDFWAALQTNYNYIMDTNLLDSCKEARCEIDGARNATKAQLDSDDYTKVRCAICPIVGLLRFYNLVIYTAGKPSITTACTCQWSTTSATMVTRNGNGYGKVADTISSDENEAGRAAKTPQGTFGKWQNNFKHFTLRRSRKKTVYRTNYTCWHYRIWIILLLIVTTW